MSADRIIDCLRRAADATRGIPAPNGLARWTRVPRDSVRDLAFELMSVPVLRQLNGMWVVFPGGGGLINWESSGIYLVDRAVDVDSTALVHDLLRFASTHEVDQTSVRAVEGITVSRKIDMGDGYSIEQPQSVPQPESASRVFSTSNEPAHGWGTSPSCAFVRRRRLKTPVVTPPSPGEAPMPGADSSDFDTASWQMLNATMLASTGAPQLREQYHVVTSLGWPFMACSGIGSSQEFPLPVPSNRLVDETRVLEFFQQLKGQDGRLDMALAKLRSSRQRLSNAERVIDLGTCLEIMLTHGQGPASEITFKVASRAAWLLGKDGEERRQIFRLASDLYAARSQAVHRGSIDAPRGKSSMQTEEALSRALISYDLLCRDLLVAIAGSSFWTSDPDWKGLVLNALAVSHD